MLPSVVMFSLSTCHATFSVLLCAGTLYGGSSSHDQSIIDLSAQLSRRSNGSVSFTQNDQSQFYTTTSLFLPHSDANHSFIIRLPHTPPSSPLLSPPLLSPLQLLLLFKTSSSCWNKRFLKPSLDNWMASVRTLDIHKAAKRMKHIGIFNSWFTHSAFVWQLLTSIVWIWVSAD